ncbi:MAG: ComEC/Rec2 family competence protein [bacterium]|nr:ComEC/Rec2 family competence protein [bacterium]
MDDYRGDIEIIVEDVNPGASGLAVTAKILKPWAGRVLIYYDLSTCLCPQTDFESCRYSSRASLRRIFFSLNPFTSEARLLRRGIVFRGYGQKSKDTVDDGSDRGPNRVGTSADDSISEGAFSADCYRSGVSVSWLNIYKWWNTREGVYRYAPGDYDYQGSLAAAVLGRGEMLDQEIWQIYRNLGLLHILVVSGFHLGIVYFFAREIAGHLELLMIRRFAAGELHDLPYLAAFLLLIMYVVVLPSAMTIGRALIAALLLTIVGVHSAKPRSFRVLLLCLLLQSIYRPGMIFEMGPQLTYAALLSIFCAIRKNEESSSQGIWAFVRAAFHVSLSASLLTGAILFMWGQRVNLLSPLLNLVLGPALSSILIILGGLALLGYSLSPEFENGLALAGYLVSGLSHFCRLLAELSQDLGLCQAVDGLTGRGLVGAMFCVVFIVLYLPQVQPALEKET